MIRFALIPACIALAACATATPEAGNPPMQEPASECDVQPAQVLIGERATEALGTQLLELTGARTLRWVPPRTAVTMDFRPDRLTVHYDDDRVIERISCG
ncbi:I78 family peptidase inhibitor [Aurantiacibacter poecillastricola]|uniref:I78 family peptidase inhibitor n=1 Tax=Aurantiacibacter poecillastricola TaxID=3064385 RepID=UPI00273EEC86|nr:I78 family peptidase inhibitor [Aurantiacibacter sp. 219JJ12-13]MDP5263153.1 I78 family peptidase inhibitor [Aurantiacibacter sp. 219JJ12-13]